MGNIVLWVLPALHLIICAVIFAMMRLNKLRTRHVIFPAVVLLPVCGCEFPYKSRVMPTSEPLKTLKAPYMARNTMKWGFFRLKSQ